MKIPKNTMTLKQFMLRKEVLQLYREILKTIREVPQIQDQNDLKDWVRRDFQTYKHQNDEIAIKTLIQHGKKSLKELKTSLNLSSCNKEK